MHCQHVHRHGEGDSKSRQVIRQLARHNPGTRTSLWVAMPRDPQEEIAALPAVAEVVTDKRELPDLLGRFGVVDIPAASRDFTAGNVRTSKSRTAACSAAVFALFRTVRPHLVSRPLEHILDEVRDWSTPATAKSC